MKTKSVEALLLCMFMLILASFGHAQDIAPPILPDIQVPLEILMGLMGRYTTMMQEYQSLVQAGGMPDSSIKFRMTARIIIPGEGEDAQLTVAMPGGAKVTFWLEANISARNPDMTRINLSGSLGDIEILATQAGVTFVSRAEAIFYVMEGLPSSDEISGFIPEISQAMPLESLLLGDLPVTDLDFAAYLGLMQQQLGEVLTLYLAAADMQYEGQELTPKGIAHVVRLAFAEDSLIVTLWILDDTWELYKVGFDDPIDGESMVIVIEQIELIAATLPDPAFDVDTSTLAQIQRNDFIDLLGLKLLSVASAGRPVAADLAVSASTVAQGETAIVSSNGLDTEDDESRLVAQIEYRDSTGVWMPLSAGYVGPAPFGRWEAAFGPPLTDVLEVYDFRVAYADTSGAVSDTLELLGALEVILIPPRAELLSPGDGEADVPLTSRVSVTFDQEMDKASVESAFSMADPSGQIVSGAYEWTDTSFVFSPDQELMFGVDYTVKILGTAMAVTGATLDANMDGIGGGLPEDDLVWQFTTEYAPLPKVSAFSPNDKQLDVLVSAQVSVTFTEVMDKASVESAFSMADPSGQIVSGAYEWTDNSFVFSPDQELMFGVDYTVKILGTASAVTGATLDANMDGVGGGSPEDDLVWQFTTEYAPIPGVSAFSPQDKQLNVLVSEQVSVTFTEAMDQASVENVFSLVSSEGQSVSGAFQWTDNTLVFVPSQNLEYNATYQAQVSGAAVSAKGAGLDANGDGVAEGSPKDDLTWSFSTEKHAVIALKPASQIVLPREILTIDLVAQNVSQLSNFSLTISFDPDLLKLLKIKRASFANWRPRPKRITDVDKWRPTAIDQEKGLVTLAADSTRSGGVTGTGVIATLTFRAIAVGSLTVELQDVSFINAAEEDIAPDLRGSDVLITEFSVWDANKDGFVDISDFIKIQEERGAVADVNGDGVVNILDIIAASGDVQTSPAFVESDGTGPNYPNPFNPETWIPYQLTRSADVVISIYSVTGQLVKTLNLGHKNAGRYATRAAAAYWDGTNEAGQRVASGIYYYRFNAGSFSAIRKMVILE